MILYLYKHHTTIPYSTQTVVYTYIYFLQTVVLICHKIYFRCCVFQRFRQYEFAPVRFNPERSGQGRPDGSLHDTSAQC